MLVKGNCIFSDVLYKQKIALQSISYQYIDKHLMYEFTKSILLFPMALDKIFNG